MDSLLKSISYKEKKYMKKSLPSVPFQTLIDIYKLARDSLRSGGES